MVQFNRGKYPLIPFPFVGVLARFENIRFSPKLIAGVYIVVGVGLLGFFDFVLPEYIGGQQLVNIQAIKGGAEVIISALLIYGLSTRGQTQLEDRKAEIEQQRTELSVLHRVLRHNLRNDINVISGKADLIKQRTDDKKIIDHTTAIQNQADTVLGYTSKAKQIRQLKEVVKIDLDLATFAQNLFNNHPQIDDSVAVDIDIDSDLTVRVKSLFGIAMNELLTNAVKHNDSDQVRIEVLAYEDPDNPNYVVLETNDNGPGVIEDVITVMQKGEHSQLKHLNGLGLWLVYWTVIESGGSFDIEAENGTRFKLRLPKA